MRTFAAATIVAVAAAMTAGGALVVSVVGGIESLGILAGRSTVTLTDMPSGLTTAEQVRTLTRAAEGAGVDASLLVPDRDGRPGAWDAYVLRGEPSHPVFGGDLEVLPVADGRDLDLRTAVALDGSGDEIQAFLGAIDRAGYAFVDDTPGIAEPLSVELSRPMTLGAAASVAIGVVVALVAESVRRGPRQRLRRTAGWSATRIALHEAGEAGCVVVPLALATSAAFVVVLWWGHASATVWTTTMLTLFAVLLPLAVAITVTHVGCTLWWARDGAVRGGVQSLRPVVATAAIALIALAVVDVRGASDSRSAAQELRHQLEAEDEHGDDVVLGTTFTEFEQDVAFGALALGPLRAGTAGLAHSAFADDVTVAGDIGPAAEAYRSLVADSAAPVLLVPHAVRTPLASLEAAATTSLAEGWEVEGRSPPGDVSVRGVRVETTAPVVESVSNWSGAAPSDFDTWPEVPVLVVPDPSFLAPNRLGTAVANGEVRFSDRTALERAVSDAGLDETVLQVRRVGATVEGKLAAVRAEQLHAEVLTGVTVLALFFAAYTLTVDHRARTARANRVIRLAGRHAAIRHRGFVLAGTSVTFVAVLGTDVAVSGPSGSAVLWAGLAALAVGALLTCLLGLTAHRGRTIR